jgi:hypothetical protein
MPENIAEPGKVVQLRAAEVADEVHFEAAEPPVYLDTTTIQRRPIIPHGLRRENIRATIGQQAGLRGHQARYHGLRSPLYLLAYGWHTVRGAARVTTTVLTWWHWPAGWVLESQAVAAGRAGHHEAMRAQTQGLKTRAARGRIVAACALVAVVAIVLAVLLAPRWLLALLALIVTAGLARAGRPAARSSGPPSSHPCTRRRRLRSSPGPWAAWASPASTRRSATASRSDS